MKKLPIPNPDNLPVDPISSTASSFSTLVTVWKEYKTIAEAEKTKRHIISEQSAVAIKRIEAQKDVLKHYINSSFTERANQFNKLFSELDKGIETNNTQLIDLAMGGIVQQMKTSPLTGIKDILQQIDDDNVDVIDI